MSWKSYTKIDCPEIRAEDGSKRIIEGAFRSKAVEWLKDLKWSATEKVDGTNVSLFFDGCTLTLHGRTENVQIPKELVEAFEAKFCNSRTEQMLEQLFPPRLIEDEPMIENLSFVEVTIYGEGIGPKIQKVGKLYGPEYRFLVFDIKVGGTYLDHDSDFYRKIVEALGLEEVPKLDDMTIEEAKAFVKSKPRSLINEAAPMEGVVLQPKVRLYEANGRRVIVKIKAKDYEPFNAAAEKYGWVKRGKAVVTHIVEPDGRTIAYRPVRCTIRDILRTGFNSGSIEKVDSEDNHVVLADIDRPGVEYIAPPGELSRYDKQKWEESNGKEG